MTISIGLIPNRETVMIIQDAEATYPGVGFTQDIYRKIKEIDGNAVTGVIGMPLIANEIIDLVKETPSKSGRELSDKVEQAYHLVRNRHLQRGVLAKYGFSDIKELVMTPQNMQVNSNVVEEVLKIANNQNNFFSLELMLATNYERPLLYITTFPGVSFLHSEIKDYAVSGSGSTMGLEKMGVELKNYRWKNALSIDEGMDILMKAGKASEKHIGVGGPFEIVYITKQNKESQLVRSNQKKINMVMYLLELNEGQNEIEEEVMNEAITKMRNEKISAEDLAEFIKSKTPVGIEFDNYFGLKRKSPIKPQL